MDTLVIYRQSTKRKVAAAAVRCDINNDQSHGIWSTGEKPPLVSLNFEYF